MTRLACLLTALACATPSAVADVSLSLAPSTEPSTSGEVRFDLLALNEDPNAADAFDAPPTLAVRLTTEDGVAAVVATRVGSAGRVDVAAGGFARVRYVARHRTIGRVVVELDDGRAATVVNVVAPGAQPLGPPTTGSIATEQTPRPAPRNPIEAVVQRDPNFRTELGLVEFLANRIKAHEPVYIVAGDEEPSTTFQLSFKYQVFDPNGPISQAVPALAGLYFGYSQTSFWDLGEDSNPFFDTSYRPEALLSYDDLDRFVRDRDGDRLLPEWLNLGVQAGYRHESNGRDGDDSRSLNIVYVRPIVTVSGEDGWFLSLAPRAWAYVHDLDDNPDIEDFRGHADLRLVVGQGGGVQLGATTRLGNAGENGALQLDLTVPLRQLSRGNLDVYFYTQYFIGTGESLLRYDETDYSLRFGVSLVR